MLSEVYLINIKNGKASENFNFSIYLLMMIVQRIVNSVFASNTYIISVAGLKKCWLIDVGDVDKVLDKVPTGSLVNGIFLTHTHYDHIYGVNKLLEFYPNCLIYTSLFGKEALSSNKLNISRYFNKPFEYKGNNIVVLREKDIVQLGDIVKIMVFETPGHDKSCLTYKINHCLFTGDAFIPGLKVASSFPNSNKVDAELSRERILSLSENCNLYPGHGDICEKIQTE